MDTAQYSFLNDYSEGAHPRILEALAQSNLQQEYGYGEDRICAEARRLICTHINKPDADVHFVTGGTQANLLVISSMLRPYEAVIAVDSGHIFSHEAGAIEATGHKICVVASPDGKLSTELIDGVCKEHKGEHMVKPRLVYISNSTEIGTIYSKAELQEIAEYCRVHNLYFFVDGARLGTALASSKNDMTMADFATYPDVFYIGATKNGGLLGEAIVINNPAFKHEFRFNMKQRGAMLAKGRVLGIQFRELFRDNLFYDLAIHANRMAEKMAHAIKKAGYEFYTEPVSNQLFPILPNALIETLRRHYAFLVWKKLEPPEADDHAVIRLVTSWACSEAQADAFVDRISSVQ